ncbi:MAG TPA: NUDIX hydrolase [Candidatus Paceibacterota bacterium]|nr:NUDIX hydrolase [Candidatus Paceibacterota bacterium]
MKNRQKTHHQHGSFIILNINGKILFIQREDNGKWEIPGGGFNSDETDYKNVLLREVQEETGIILAPDTIELCAVLGQRLKKETIAYYGGRASAGFTFLYCATIAPQKISLSWEHTDYRLFSHKEILSDYPQVSSGPLWFYFTYLEFCRTGKVQQGTLFEKRFFEGKEYYSKT